MTVYVIEARDRKGVWKEMGRTYNESNMKTQVYRLERSGMHVRVIEREEKLYKPLVPLRRMT